MNAIGTEGGVKSEELENEEIKIQITQLEQQN